ncbi:MAG: CARDB domain-containing protein, partial [Phycisphaerales bacterium]
MRSLLSGVLSAFLGRSDSNSRRLAAVAGKGLSRRAARRGTEIEALEGRQLLAADLTVELNFAPVTVLPTQEFSGTFTLRNLGDTTADNFVTRIVLSLDNIFGNGDDIAVEDIPESGDGGLVAGEVFSIMGGLTIPSVIAPGNYFLLARVDVNGEVAENDEGNNTYISPMAIITVAPNPVVSVSASDSLANETAGDNGRITFTRTGPTALGLTVSYALSGTATAIDDYTALSGMVTFAPGETSVTILIEPFDDGLPESNETVIVTLQAGDGYTVDAGAPSATVTIVDNEDVSAPAADLVGAIAGATGEFLQGETIAATFGRQNTGTVAANNFTTRFVLSIDNIFGNEDDIFVLDVLNTVQLNGGGISASAVNLVVPSSAVALQAYYLLARIDVLNSIAELDESNNTFGTDTPDIMIAPPPTISIATTDGSASETPGNTGAFTLTRTGPTGLGLTVNLMITGTAVNGTDYAMIPATAFFAAGSSTAVVTIMPTDDTAPEDTETVVLTLAAGTGYTIDAMANTATLNILDNEPLISVVATTATTSETTGIAAGRFTFTRAGSTAEEITVTFLVTGTGTD